MGNWLHDGAVDNTKLEATGKNSTSVMNSELHHKVNKVTKWSNFQQVRKIQLNSLYGVLGNQYSSLSSR